MSGGGAGKGKGGGGGGAKGKAGGAAAGAANPPSENPLESRDSARKHVQFLLGQVAYNKATTKDIRGRLEKDFPTSKDLKQFGKHTGYKPKPGPARDGSRNSWQKVAEQIVTGAQVIKRIR